MSTRDGGLRPVRVTEHVPRDRWSCTWQCAGGGARGRKAGQRSRENSTRGAVLMAFPIPVSDASPGGLLTRGWGEGPPQSDRSLQAATPSREPTSCVHTSQPRSPPPRQVGVQHEGQPLPALPAAALRPHTGPERPLPAAAGCFSSGDRAHLPTAAAHSAGGRPCVSVGPAAGQPLSGSWAPNRLVCVSPDWSALQTWRLSAARTGPRAGPGQGRGSWGWEQGPGSGQALGHRREGPIGYTDPGPLGWSAVTRNASETFFWSMFRGPSCGGASASGRWEQAGSETGWTSPSDLH